MAGWKGLLCSVKGMESEIKINGQGRYVWVSAKGPGMAEKGVVRNQRDGRVQRT